MSSANRGIPKYGDWVPLLKQLEKKIVAKYVYVTTYS